MNVLSHDHEVVRLLNCIKRFLESSISTLPGRQVDACTGDGGDARAVHALDRLKTYRRRIGPCGCPGDFERMHPIDLSNPQRATCSGAGCHSSCTGDGNTFEPTSVSGRVKTGRISARGRAVAAATAA